MIAIRTNLRKLGADKRGATAIEYGLIFSLIAVAAIGGHAVVGRRLQRHVDPNPQSVQNAG